jgi:HME family heavy-metal exporter
MTIKKAPGTNTLAITAGVDALLKDLEPNLPAGIHINDEIFRQADFINLSVNNVVHALRDAAIIVALILALFLLSLRTTLVTLTALPLSLAAGVLVLEYLGETINVMTLGGLAIAVGSLVDDAVIDVENVFRRLKQNARLPVAQQQTRRDTIFSASNEIRPAMVFATLIIGLVFAPLMFLEGIEGRFFRPLGIAFVVSLLASLIVALTVTPALCTLLLNPNAEEAETGDGFLVRILKDLYEPLLRLALRWRYLLMGAAAAATALTLWVGSTFGSSFLPEFNEGTFTVALFAPPGTSLRASDRLASSVEQQLLQLEGVASASRRTGRSERDEHVEPVSNSEIDVTIRPGFAKETVRSQISSVLEEIPGISSNIGQPIEHRLSHILSGTPAAIAISVYGQELSVLRSIAKEIEVVLKALPGTRDVAANREVMVQSVPVEYRPSLLAAYGLTPASAALQVRDAMFGASVAQVNDGVRRYGLAVRLQTQDRDSIEDLKRLVLRGAGGALVRLEEIADIGRELTSNLIARENSQRKAVISLNVAQGSNLGHLVAEVQTKVDPIVARHGYRVKYGGQFEAQQSASRAILLFGGVVLLITLVLLHLAIGSLSVSLLVLVNLPLAMIGGIAAVFWTESDAPLQNLAGLVGLGSYTPPVLSIASMVGFITLFGIAVRNGILLVNHYAHLRENEGCSTHRAIMQGSLERLVPILMTALTAALALVPIVLEGNSAGNEILAPLSAVILGGLLTSTFLNLVLVPAGYAALNGRKRPISPSSKP